MNFSGLKNLSANFLDIYGFRSRQKYVVFDSDDWGAIRAPSSEALKRLGRLDGGILKNSYLINDALESEEDLLMLFEVLKHHIGGDGRHPIITFNTIMANPDFDKIEKSDFEKYYFEPFYQTLARERGKEVLDAWRQGVGEGFIKPQLHGREHVHVPYWLSELRHGNKLLLEAFQARCYGIPITTNIPIASPILQAALDRKGFEDEASFHSQSLEDAARLFQSHFGFRSKSFVYPNYHWHGDLDQTLSKQNVDFIKGIRFQFQNDGSHSPTNRVLHYMGQRNALGQYHLIRNVFFEPALSGTDLDLGQLLKRMRRIFALGGVVVVGTHRLNFMGSLNRGNRDGNLKLLNAFLGALINEWPEVRFISSDELGEMIRNSKE